MDAETFKWLASLGVGGVLAGVIFWFYRADMLAHTAQWKGVAETMMQIVKDNTVAITNNTSTIQALHRRDDRIEEALGKLGFGFPHRGAGKGESSKDT